MAFDNFRTMAPTIAELRGAVVDSICIYGVRRVSEALALQRSSICFGVDYATVWVERQRNGVYGRGVRCWTPLLPMLDGAFARTLF